MTTQLKEAVLWQALEDRRVRCGLCNFKCKISEGKLGQCRVRQNIGGTLYSLNYHQICSTAVDPIEKKPLFHFQPGSRSLSIAAPGCNFQCDFCQNWQISQLPRTQKSLIGRSYNLDDIINAARQNNCRSISYTYTEPTVFMELGADCGRLAKKIGLANIFVSNGYMTIEALEFARDFLDGINVDLKAFSDQFYQKQCKASLEPVLQTLRHIARQTDIWLEVTTLVIPGLNDSDEELKQIAGFIAEDLGEHVPWHISRFHPDYEQKNGSPTPSETLMRAHELGLNAGLKYVFIGNLPGSGHENTLCHACGKLLIERTGFRIGANNIINGACPDCGATVPGKDMDPIQI